MPREGVERKGRRLLTEGRLTVRRVGPGGLIAAECKGDSGAVYRLGYDGEQWSCDCQALSRCSHLVALMLVVSIEQARS
jgi:uncharacterized Zn finger protein